MNADGAGGHQRRRRGQGARGRGPQGTTTQVDTAALAGAGFGEHRRSLIETALLVALVEARGHGYELVERAQQLVGDELYIDSGSVYRILRLLEEAGMIASSWEAGVAGPQRRTYAVLPAGRELLRSWAEALAARGNAFLDLSKIAHERLTQQKGSQEPEGSK